MLNVITTEKAVIKLWSPPTLWAAVRVALADHIQTTDARPGGRRADFPVEL
jgi:hypothetical protein